LGEDAIKLYNGLETCIKSLQIGADKKAEIIMNIIASNDKIRDMLKTLLEQSQLFAKYITIGSSAGAFVGVVIGMKYWEPQNNKGEVVKVAVGGAFVGALTGGSIGYLTAKFISLIIGY
jgi:uncharacterized membrane protein